ncbi:unnamed protein product [Mytilus coruscus]|uniref:Uncharacterized protein n=1 Tax=Mytilus coruscus TaxID=42192 RepID=A0A6J8APJ4_MYTCO|nr:unnamed protein product [Mytilus coruscus]
MIPKPANQIADEVIIDEDEMVEVESAREELWDSVRTYEDKQMNRRLRRVGMSYRMWPHAQKHPRCSFLDSWVGAESQPELLCEDIRAPTSWNVIPHVAPRPEAPRCSFWILGLEPEPELLYEDILGQTDEQASPTSWNVIPHVTPRKQHESPLWILGFDHLHVAYPELPSNNQPEHCTTVVHRARLFSVMVPKPDDDVIIDEDEMVELDQLARSSGTGLRSAMK